MILRLLDFLSGWVQFFVSGSFCDVFFKDCRFYGIRLYDIKHKNDGYFCRASVSDYRRLLRIRRKSRVKIKLTKKVGIRFLLFRNRHRIGVPAGILLSVIFIIFASNRIWCINIVGNDGIDESKIYASLEKLNVAVGVKKNDLDTRSLSHLLVVNTPEIAWSAFNINGSVLTVEIDERTFAPNTIDQKSPCNIIADFDGIIENMEVYKGEAMFVKGSAVKKGDILVSGITELSNGVTVFSHSNAKITAVTNEAVCFELPLTQSVTTNTGNVNKISAFSAYNLKLPLYLTVPHYKSYRKEIIEKPLTVNGQKLPVSITDIIFYETKTNTVTYSSGEVNDMLKKLIEEYELENLSNAEILEKEETFSQNEDTLSVTVKYIIKKSMGTEQKITVTQ